MGVQFWDLGPKNLRPQEEDQIPLFILIHNRPFSWLKLSLSRIIGSALRPLFFQYLNLHQLTVV